MVLSYVQLFGSGIVSVNASFVYQYCDFCVITQNYIGIFYFCRLILTYYL